MRARAAGLRAAGDGPLSARAAALLGFLAAAACGGAGTEAASPGVAGRSLSPAEIARRATPAVVQIRAHGRVGSGFVVDPSGLIATSLHVVEDATELVVVLADGRTFVRVEVVAFDETNDLVVLAIAASGLPALRLAGQPIAAGERVVAIGHPQGLENTVSDGLVGAVRKDVTGADVLQITAPISPGSSGGPVLDEHGEVVGVAASTHRIGQNLNFASPVHHLVPLIAARERRPLSALPSRFASRLFARCEADDLVAVYLGVGRARRTRGRRSYDAVEASVMDLALDMEGCPGVTRMLLFALEEASEHEDPDERTAVLAIVLGEIEGALRQMMRGPQP